MSHDSGQEAYFSFWSDVGAHFPSLKGAPWTAYYFDCERTLFESFFPPLTGRSILKTDLWDEAKNTEILRWAADHGARPFGVDVAFDVVDEARKIVSVTRPVSWVVTSAACRSRKVTST